MDIGTVVFSKTASTGAAVEIKLDAIDAYGYPHPTFRADVDGVGAEMSASDTLVIKRGLYGFGAGPTVGLTDAERKELEAAMATVAVETRAAYATPEGQADALRQQRRDLVSAVTATYDAEGSRFYAAHDRQDETAWTGKAAGESRIEAALAALAAFDAAHPDIRAEVVAAREAKAAANVAAAWHN